ESESGVHRRPLPASVAQHHDHHRGLVPGAALLPAGAVPDLLPLVLEVVPLHLEGGVAQLEGPHLLHPEAELLIGILEGVVEIFLLLRVLDDEILPGLAVRPGHRPAARLEDLIHVLLGMGSGLMRRTLMRVVMMRYRTS